MFNPKPTTGCLDCELRQKTREQDLMEYVKEFGSDDPVHDICTMCYTSLIKAYVSSQVGEWHIRDDRACISGFANK